MPTLENFKTNLDRPCVHLWTAEGLISKDTTLEGPFGPKPLIHEDKRVGDRDHGCDGSCIVMGMQLGGRCSKGAIIKSIHQFIGEPGATDFMKIFRRHTEFARDHAHLEETHPSSNDEKHALPNHVEVNYPLWTIPCAA